MTYYVYILRGYCTTSAGKESIFKIGYTKDIKRRIVALKRKLGPGYHHGFIEEIDKEEFYLLALPSKSQAMSVECYVHETLTKIGTDNGFPLHICGEWFSLTETNAFALSLFLEKKYGTQRPRRPQLQSLACSTAN